MALMACATGIFAGGFAAPAPVTAQAASAEASVLTLASFWFDGQDRAISRAPSIDPDDLATFYRSYSACRTTCIVPADAAPGVRTIAETEVIAFVRDVVVAGRGILLDGRPVQDRQLGHIATSVNMPLSLVSPDNPYFGQILEALGARRAAEDFDFAGALPLVVSDAGPTTNDAATLIGSLIDAGYLADKIQYYRGGMLIWVALGLSFEE